MRFLLLLVMFPLSSMLRKVKTFFFFHCRTPTNASAKFYIQGLYLHIINWVMLLGDNEHNGNVSINACGRI